MSIDPPHEQPGGGGGGSSFTGGTGISNARVSHTGNNGSVNSGNGEAVFSYTRPVADIAVRLACPTHMSVGGTGRCHLTVTDNGPDAATRVTAAPCHGARERQSGPSLSRP